MPQNKHRFQQALPQKLSQRLFFAFLRYLQMSDSEDLTAISVEDITGFLKNIYVEKLHESIDEKKPLIEEIIDEIQEEIESKNNQIEIARHNINTLEEMKTIWAEYLDIDFKRNNLILKNSNLFKDLNVHVANVAKTMTDQYRFDDQISKEKELIRNLEGERENIKLSLKNRVREKINIEVDIDELIQKCEICFEKYDHNDHWESCINICGHKFGSSCLIKVLECNSRCPKCNKKFGKDNILTLF